jgi:hypothetical protein
MSDGGCIFCGKIPQTKTHIFRKAWIDRLMVPSQGPFETIHDTADLTGASREGNWPSEEFSMAPGAACAPCNNGWMDDIDRAAEQIVEPMVVGHKATVRLFHDQKAVARWVSQVAILMDQTQIQQVVPAEIARRFHDDQEPLAGMTVWLARTGMDWSVEGWQRAWVLTTGTHSETAPRPNMSLFTFRIVNLVVQALVPLDDAAQRTFGVSRGENMRFLRQIWPSRYAPVSWPPPVTIRPDTVEAFARSFEPPGTSPGDEWFS